MKYKSIPELFITKAQRFGEKTLVRYQKRANSELESISWNEIYDQVESISLGLAKLGAKAKDNIGLLSITNQKWMCCDLAVLSLGACTVPLYHNSSEDAIFHIINHAQLDYVFVHNKIQLQKIRSNFDKLENLKYVIVLEDRGDIPKNQPRIITLDDILRIGEKERKDKPNLFQEQIKKINDDDLATIIYTSGTTGIPKGVPLTHKNCLLAALSIYEYVPLHGKHRMLSFLPLAHVFERVCGEFYGLDQGVTFVYCPIPEDIPKLLHTEKITMMLVVPRILEKMYAKIMGELQKQPEMIKDTILKAIDFGINYHKKKIANKPISFLENIAYTTAKKTLLAKIKNKLAPHLEFFVSGGAPLNHEISYFFKAIGIEILEGYGLTETAAPLTVNPLLRNKTGTVGIPFGHFDLKLGSDKEILCQGPSLFPGYYKDEAATNECIIDGWFHTGDLGEFDDEGYLKIIGRKKDLLITAGGKNVAPTKIEHKLCQSNFINQVVVLGDRERYLAALVVIDQDYLYKRNKDSETKMDLSGKLSENADLHELIRNEIDKHSLGLDNFETIKKFAILDEELSIDGGELTPTMKVKRNVVNEKYSELIKTLF